MSNYTLELVHVGGSRKTVEVLGCDAGSFPRLLLTWPTAGIYVLDIRANVLRVSDCTHNRRKALPWSAANPDYARDLWIMYRKARDQQLHPIVRPKPLHKAPR